MKTVKRGGTLTFFVNDEPLLECSDPRPLSGGLLGLRTWLTHLWWSDIRLTEISVA